MAQIILDSNNNLIQGDFDNATVNNRTKFKTTTTNATTNVYAVPNGSATSAGYSVANNADPTNCSKIVMATNGSTDTQIISGINGSGTYLPMSFYVNNTLALQISTAGVVSAPYGGFSGAGPVLKVVTDTTDISVTALPSAGYSTIGSTFSVSIPTTGCIAIRNLVMKITNNQATYAGPTLGLRIGSTNYWLNSASYNSVTTYNQAFISGGGSLSDVTINYNGVGGAALSYNYGITHLIDIVASGIPTGTQTVQLIVGKSTNFTSNFTIGGSTVTTRIGVEFSSAS